MKDIPFNLDFFGLRGLLALADLLVVVVAAEYSSVRGRKVTAVAGSVVNFNCTLDVQCFNQSVRWVKRRKYTQPVNWYNGGAVNPSLKLRNISFVDDVTHGWSMLTIHQVRYEDQGHFLCQVSTINGCKMTFQLTVTGNK